MGSPFVTGIFARGPASTAPSDLPVPHHSRTGRREAGSTTAIARHLHKHKANVGHELANLIQAGKEVKGQGDGRVASYHLPE
jgi:hypothetical protein